MDTEISTSYSFDGDATEKNIASALYQFGSEVMGVSKDRVPVDTGALMNTGQVSLPEVNGSEISISLSYGSQSVDYAAAVHENMEPSVHWTRPGSGPKYLENPVKEMQDQLPARLADAAKEGMK